MMVMPGLLILIMGLAISELDTLDATERMALSQRDGTLSGGKHTCFQDG